MAASLSLRRAWYSLGVGAKELRCDMTLVNGQSFAWRLINAPVLTNKGTSPRTVKAKGRAKEESKAGALAVSVAASASSSSSLPEYLGVVGRRVFCVKQARARTC